MLLGGKEEKARLVKAAELSKVTHFDKRRDKTDGKQYTTFKTFDRPTEDF